MESDKWDKCIMSAGKNEAVIAHYPNSGAFDALLVHRHIHFGELPFTVKTEWHSLIASACVGRPNFWRSYSFPLSNHCHLGTLWIVLRESVVIFLLKENNLIFHREKSTHHDLLLLLLLLLLRVYSGVVGIIEMETEFWNQMKFN